MGREWFHTKLLKRGGRFLKPGGVGGTQPGELAVRCRVCPWPGVNSPSDLSAVPQEKRYAASGSVSRIHLTSSRFLHRLILHEDANFRLKNRAHARAAQDDTMGPGFAYFVSPEPFAKHILDYLNTFGDKEEVSAAFRRQARSHAAGSG
jgi:hypothetical protein